MKASLALCLVSLGSMACVGITDPGDDEVGDVSDESDMSDESSSTGETTTDSTDETESDETESDTTEADTTETDTTETDATETDATDTDVMPGACEGVGSSDLPGVCIWFPAPGDVWALEQAAQGIAIPYHVIVEADVADVVPLPQDGGMCGQPDESGLIVFARLEGGDELYCLCDVGLCPGRPPAPATLAAGDTPLEFEWNGLNWTGPSDTNNPYGPPFPAGDYTLEISAVGTADGVPFTVSNTFTVTLIEVP